VYNYRIIYIFVNMYENRDSKVFFEAFEGKFSNWQDVPFIEEIFRIYS
jgi:hypothetical protein